MRLHKIPPKAALPLVLMLRLWPKSAGGHARSLPTRGEGDPANRIPSHYPLALAAVAPRACARLCVCTAVALASSHGSA